MPRIVGAAVLALCAFFALGPDAWVEAVLPLPWTDTAHALARAIFVVIGAGAGVLLWRSFKKTDATGP